jgi:hypothetical protein
MTENLEYLNRRLEEQAAWHSKRSKRNKKSFYLVEITTLLAGALIPLINIFNMDDYSRRWLSGVLASISVVAVGISKLFKFQENWLSFRGVEEGLRREKELYLNGVGEYDLPIDQERLKRLVARVEGTIATTTSQFIDLHRAERQRPQTQGLSEPKKPTENAQ